MATLLHALAALVLGNFRLASFFERAHSGFSDCEPGIQPSNPPRCNLLLCLQHQALRLKRHRMDDAVERCLQRLIRWLRVNTWPRLHLVKERGDGVVLRPAYRLLDTLAPTADHLVGLDKGSPNLTNYLRCVQAVV